MSRLLVPALCLALASCGGSMLFSGESEFRFKSSYDGSEQKAMSFVPEGLDESPRPLLIVAHYMTGDRTTAKSIGYYEECQKRGWLLACPDLHGAKTSGKTALGSLQAQHDIMDCVAYMQGKYKVDPSRIYIAGRSMGGMQALLSAAKHPDVFAAVVAGQPIADLGKWHEFSQPGIRNSIEAECGKFNDANSFEYMRRSPINYVEGLQHLPVVMWHGTADPLVPPSQTSELHESLIKLCPYQEPVKWLVGAPHSGPNMPASWICSQLEIYQNIREGGAQGRRYESLSFTTDESQSFFWLSLELKEKGHFAKVTAAPAESGAMHIKTENLSSITIDTGKMLRTPRSYEIESDGSLSIRIKRKDREDFEKTIQGSGSFHLR